MGALGPVCDYFVTDRLHRSGPGRGDELAASHFRIYHSSGLRGRYHFHAPDYRSEIEDHFHGV